MAPRSSWTGYLRLSLVSCPVRLYPATSSGARISFNQLHKKTHNRINMKPVDPELGLVERSDLVRGYEYEDKKYVIIEDDDLAVGGSRCRYTSLGSVTHRQHGQNLSRTLKTAEKRPSNISNRSAESCTVSGMLSATMTDIICGKLRIMCPWQLQRSPSALVERLVPFKRQSC